VQTDALRWLVVPMTKSAQRGVVWLEMFSG
jgi:hypothetical protein